MKRADPQFQQMLSEATDWLMREFTAWNALQGELLAKGYESNYYSKEDMSAERRLYEAIAERFLLEDEDFRAWRWLETLWSGGDGNTGFDAYVVEFVPCPEVEQGTGVLSFYVTRNARFWFAVPLAELPTPDGSLEALAVNSIHRAIVATECVASVGAE